MTELVVNPFLNQRLYYNQDGDVVMSLTAPKKGVGVKPLEFCRHERPELYDLIDELRQTSFNFLDVDEDLSVAERELLTEHNILLPADEIPAPPLFACRLDEIEVEESFNSPADLIVSPHFSLEKAEAFDVLMRRRTFGMLPSAPIAWVTDEEGTKLTLGYWLNAELAEIVSQFKAGEKIEVELSAPHRAALETAKILVTPQYSAERKREWDAQIEEAAAFFQREKYVLLNQILPPAQLRAIADYLLTLRGEGFMTFNDRQVERRFAVHNDALATYFHQNLADLISRVVSEKVKPSYVFSAIYAEGAVLEPHTDRPQCEFTVSLQIDYQPKLKTNEPSPWALCLDDLREEKIESYLRCGDGLIYKGCELVHYRNALFAGHQSTSIFLHYVPESFSGSLT